MCRFVQHRRSTWRRSRAMQTLGPRRSLSRKTFILPALKLSAVNDLVIFTSLFNTTLFVVTACAAIASNRTNAAARIILPLCLLCNCDCLSVCVGSGGAGPDSGAAGGNRRSVNPRPILGRAIVKRRKQHCLTRSIALPSFFHLTQKETPPRFLPSTVVLERRLEGVGLSYMMWSSKHETAMTCTSNGPRWSRRTRAGIILCDVE